MIGDTALECASARSVSVLIEGELISEGDDMSQQRTISRAEAILERWSDIPPKPMEPTGVSPSLTGH
jgi:hypothetical protein